MKENDMVMQRWEDLQTKLVTWTQLFKEHIEGCDKADEAARWLCQVVGTLDCLDMLVRVDGLDIPTERIELLKNEKAKYKAHIDAIEFPNIFPEDLEVAPSSAPTHAATMQLLSTPRIVSSLKFLMPKHPLFLFQLNLSFFLFVCSIFDSRTSCCFSFLFFFMTSFKPSL